MSWGMWAKSAVGSHVLAHAASSSVIRHIRFSCCMPGLDGDTNWQPGWWSFCMLSGSATMESGTSGAPRRVTGISTRTSGPVSQAFSRTRSKYYWGG